MRWIWSSPAAGWCSPIARCSPKKGEALVERFLAERAAEVELDPIRPDEVPGTANYLDARGRLRTTPADLDLGAPGLSGLDGFFAARFRCLH